MLPKRKKTKSYHGCIFVPKLNKMMKYVIEEQHLVESNKYLVVRFYPLKKHDVGTKYVFKAINDYFKQGDWIKIGNMYKQE